jgi:3-oxoacyl-[acyl-carrier protein] reductase
MTVKEAYDLSGRNAVVTGAGSGIGRSSALLLAEAGAAVVCADVNEAGAKATAEAIADAGGRAVSTGVDVTDRADVDRLIDRAVESLGSVDIMCNIAGIMHENAEIVDTTDETLERVLAVNLKGVFYGCRAAARRMVAQGSGSIINMASGAVDVPAPGIGPYAIAKAGVAQLTKTLAMEVAKQGVRVNAVAPGFVITGMTARHWTNPDGTLDPDREQATRTGFGRMSPLGRVGEPDDIGHAVLYLASDASSFMTGQILRPNGGVTMPW